MEARRAVFWRWRGNTAMKTINLATPDRPLAEYAANLGREIVVLTDRNRPVAAIVPLTNVDQKSLALSSHPEFLQFIAEARAEIASGRKLSMEEMKRAVLPKPPPERRKRPTVHVRPPHHDGHGGSGVAALDLRVARTAAAISSTSKCSQTRSQTTRRGLPLTPRAS